MVKKYVFGNPFETYAVECEKNVINADAGDLISWKKRSIEYSDWDYNGCVMEYEYELADDEAVYGLGEHIRDVNKRGWIYESKCSDDPSHDEGKTSLYGAHNFLMTVGEDVKGMFIDYPGKIIFDVGFSVFSSMKIDVYSDNFKLYIITAEDGLSKSEKIKAIITEFRKLIGESYIPPRWAFGYQQSRWGYKNKEDIRDVVRNYKNLDIPIEAVYLDIDYMERYKDFTVDKDRFDNFNDFVDEMKQEGIHLVPIIDAGVKIEDGYDVYEEGVDKGYFCKMEDGTDMVVGVWPGRVHLPDVLNSSAREWFGDKYKFLIDAGIDGFWNDMNEPALFYSEKHLNEVMEEIEKYKDREIDIDSFFQFKDLVNGIANNLEDYKLFYHNATIGDRQVKIRHDHVHNLYGYNMTRAAAEGMEKNAKDKRILLFSRASYIGMHRYGGVWTGDNKSWWSHILLMLNMLPSLNMCGFMYIGADMGGFGDNATEELMMRWVESSMFVPLMRNHAALGTREQELYRYKRISDFRNLIRIRYCLIPYLYSEYLKAVKQNRMMYMPPAFEFPDDKYARETQGQLFVGESIMICPVYTQNATGRYVYLPEDMTMVRMKAVYEYEMKGYKAGHHYIDVEMNEVVFFIRKGKALPIGEDVDSTDNIDISKLKLLKDEDDAAYELWWDDGVNKASEIKIFNLGNTD